MKPYYETELGKLYHGDCLEVMKTFEDNKINLTITDIPYDGVNRDSNGLRKLTKEKADIITFPLKKFVTEVDRVTKGTIIIFCEFGQLSDIYNYYNNKKNGTTRLLVWEKNNPSPMNGKNIYLSGIEVAVWHRKPHSTFNAFCKNTVFRDNAGSSKIHPTQKNGNLIKELILDNSNKGELILDTCAGSGEHLIQAEELKRNWLGVELDKNYIDKIVKRFKKGIQQVLF